MAAIYLLKRRQPKKGFGVENTFVVRAMSPAHARALASQSTNDGGFTTWLNSKESTCQRLHEEGASMVLHSELRKQP